MKDTNDIETWFKAIESGNINKIAIILENNPKLLEAKKNGEPALIFAIYKHHFNVVKFLLDKGANIETVNNLGFTALIQVAIKGCGYGMADLLIKRGANIHARNNFGNTALDFAIFSTNHESFEVENC